MMEVVSGLDSLTEFVRTTASSGVARQALLLRTERLAPSLSRAEGLRHARAALDPLVSAERARWHDLPGGRIVISWKGDQSRQVSQAVVNLTRVMQDNSGDATSVREIIDMFELPKAGFALLKAATTGLASADLESTPQPAAMQSARPDLQPLGAADLDRLEQNLAGTDLSRFARRRPVSLYDGKTARLAWEERTLSVSELIEEVAPGRDARSDVWLFRRLTRLLDRRMLSILSDAGELRGAGPFSLTLNVASVLSPEFLRFDAMLPAALRSRVVISFLPFDIASDASAFAFARNFARGRSYRVCLRAISGTLLPTLDFAALDLDFYQLIWSAELANLAELPRPGKAHWIVGQPCTREAIEWGRKRSIGLFTMRPSD